LIPERFARMRANESPTVSVGFFYFPTGFYLPSPVSVDLLFQGTYDGK
jgi:hypothetical protein